jgi:hydroxycarboxylate dehydrogenase B
MPTVEAASLLQRCAALVQAAGSRAQEAQQVAANLVEANLQGHDSHGVGMLPRYVDAVLEGGLRPNHSVQVLLDHGPLLGLDGQWGYGQVVGAQATHMAIERARAQGCAIVALRCAHHLGRIGHWAEMALQAGLVSIHFVNVLSRPIVAPFGGRDGRFGTNPMCIGIPMGWGDATQPFILDFATSRVAQGKMRVAHNEGRTVEPGLLLGADGEPTQQPAVVVVPDAQGRMGALLPFGDHKGSGLALACELLGGALTGGGTWHHPPTTARRAVHNSMLSILIDPKTLGSQDALAQEAMAFAQWVRQSPPDDALGGVQLPGEPERACKRQRLQAGIAIDDTTWGELIRAGTKVNHVF